MMGHRFLVATNLLLTCVTYVKAQWILDNRCSRRRNLGQRESPVQNASSIGILQPEHQGYEYDRNPRESYDQLDSIADTSNVTESEGDFWYHNLRGYRRSPSTSQTGAVVVAADIKRRHLFREDPSSFMMRLHWQPGNCWQGEWIERKWCMECELGDNCVAGNKLWTQFCDNSLGQKFVWVPNLSIPNSGNQNYGSLKLAYFNLCLERMTTNTYQLQPCDANSVYQVLVGWHPTSEFELHPEQNLAKCINQHHHPREFEEIANTFCETAAKHHTNLWKVYQNDNAGNEIARLRRPQCSEENPCSMCQGDCDGDNQCEGDLVCLQRQSDDVYMPVPGCTGIPNKSSDYCTSLEHLFSERITNHALRIREPECTSENPCRNPCEGDCDSDNGCFGTMKCFMRGGQNSAGEEVPGCVSSEETPPEVDFCYQPDETLSVSSQNSVLQLRGVECSEDNPCFQCQGDCDGNRDCYGPLECFQRRGENSLQAVPGCQGKGVDEVDYCYVPEGVSLPALISDTLVFEDEETQADDEDLEEQQVSSQLFQLNGVPTNEENNPLQLSDRTRTCKDDAPCQICEGDCDQDSNCASNLVCFQRRWKDPFRKVPGCVGRGVAGADYCVEP